MGAVETEVGPCVVAQLHDFVEGVRGPALPAPSKRGKIMPTEGRALAMALREESLKQSPEAFRGRLLGKPIG